jgi:putative ubiquitin-RnfH superfamily antitoxin RatB of RatAB toxin-antitoxin module
MADKLSRPIDVEVVYARREKQTLLKVTMEAGSTVRETIERSGLLQQHPEIDFARGHFGIFGRLVHLDAKVRDGDRVEIYRALMADPMDARRRRSKNRR